MNETDKIKKEITFVAFKKKNYEFQGMNESAEMCQSIIDHLLELIKYKEDHEQKPIS